MSRSIIVLVPVTYCPLCTGRHEQSCSRLSYSASTSLPHLLLESQLRAMPVKEAVATACKAVHGMQICPLDEYEVLDRTPKLYEVEDLPLKPVPDHFTGSLKVVMMIEKIDQMVDMHDLKQHAANDTLHELGLPAGFATKMPDCSMQFACVAAQTGWLLVKFLDFDKRCSVSQLKALADASNRDALHPFQ
eukprot:6129116-Amphidinium_carterae.2